MLVHGLFIYSLLLTLFDLSSVVKLHNDYVCRKKELHNIMHNKSVSTTPQIFRTKEIPEVQHTYYYFVHLFSLFLVVVMAHFYYFPCKNKKCDCDDDYTTSLHNTCFKVLPTCLFVSLPMLQKNKKMIMICFQQQCSNIRQYSIVIITSQCTDNTKPPPPPPTKILSAKTQ